MEPAVKDVVVFRLIDALGLAVFRVVEVHPFTPSQVAVAFSQVTGFLPQDVMLAFFQTSGLLRAELAGGDAGADASLLVVHAAVHFVHTRMEGTEEIEGAGAARKSGRAQQGGKSQCEKRFHNVGGGLFGFSLFRSFEDRALTFETPSKAQDSKEFRRRWKISKEVMLTSALRLHSWGGETRSTFF
jgi:hypothetical protein